MLAHCTVPHQLFYRDLGFDSKIGANNMTSMYIDPDTPNETRFGSLREKRILLSIFFVCKLRKRRKDDF